MQDGLGNIIYGSTNAPGGGGVTIAGARNGTSLDTSNFVVLGQEVGDPANPGTLLNNREVPMTGGFHINWFGGAHVMSTVEGFTPSAQLLELQGIMEAPGSIAFMNINVDSTLSGTSPVMLQMDATVPTSPGIGTAGAFIEQTINGVQTFFMAYDGQTFWRNLNTGDIFFAISDAVELVGAVGQAVLQLQPTYNTGIPAGIISDISMEGKFTAAGGGLSLVQILQAPTINQTAGSTGKIVGIQFIPGITSITGQLIAYENTIGDVLLQSNATTGRTGVHNNSSLSAWLHIGPGGSAAGNGPLKLSTGSLLTTPETGTFEFDGTHLYFTIGAIRNTIV